MAIDIPIIPLTHIHVSAAYRSRIYENFDTPRSETYFIQATYVQRTCDVPATFLWRISEVPIFVWSFTFVCTGGVSRRMCYVRVVAIKKLSLFFFYTITASSPSDASGFYENLQIIFV